MSNVAVVHCCTHLRVLGGVQSVLRRHLRRDREVGIDSSAVIFFENEPFTEAPPDTPVSGLGLRWYHSGRTLRKRFERVRPSRIAAGESWVHHDLWCLPTLADLDTETGGRRIGLLHSHWVGADQLLRACDGLLDGILCVSAATVTLARNCLPSLSPERVSWIPYPVDIPEGIPPRGEVSRKELVLGYCGRVQRPQKRVERLPAIARELRAAGVPHRWEILGAGPEVSSLRAGFAAAGSEALFHGPQTGVEYWRRLAGWDVIVFSSDYEGLPISMVEALSQGVVPLFPDLDNGGRDYTRKVASELVYPHANAAAAAGALQWLQSQPLEVRRELSARARSAAEPHGNDAYGRTFGSFVSAVAKEPRISLTGSAARRVHRGEWFPFGLLGKLGPHHPLRNGYV